jgi:bifunctional DNA-binding transcriptional regulator/antitoxin component of YhaV-PrlF toxin-antitoxin module
MAAKGSLKIPLKIRRKLGIKESTRFHVELNKQGYKIIVTPITREHIQRLHGKFKGKGLPKALIAEKGAFRRVVDISSIVSKITQSIE